MSAVVEPGRLLDPTHELMLLDHVLRERVFAWRKGRAVSVREFLEHVAYATSQLPATGSAINLCEDRYLFLVGFCAAATLGHASLLPSSRAPKAIDDVRRAYPGAYLLGEAQTCNTHHDLIRLPEFDGDEVSFGVADAAICVNPQQTAVVGFTSGSTGQPKPNIKTWENFSLGSTLNADLLTSVLGLADGEIAHVLATVPPQHMYGLELSVLLPLFGPFSVHSGRPLFPGDIAAELALLPAPRVLVTTPIHLQALLRESVQMPEIAAIVSATAPLTTELAQEAQDRFGAPVIEMFGSTETCVIAYRRTAMETQWHLYDDVELVPQPDGTLVAAGHLSMPVQLQDIVQLHVDRQFSLAGRNADLLEIAGKRASLADLSKRLSALEGVEDAVVFQLDPSANSGVSRVAALVVAPGRTDRELLTLLREQIDPLFLPRPLRVVARLPRNETGKLPREALLEAIAP